MKTIVVVVLLVFIVFLGCAFIGFQVAGDYNRPPTTTQTPDPGLEIRGEQHNLLIMRVDRVDAPQPRLISIWFSSLFFLEDHPTILTVAPLYPTKSDSANHLLAETFAFTADGDLAANFWDGINAYGVEWESYIILDNAGANLILQWLVGPGDFSGVLEAAASSPGSSVAMVEQTCKSIADASQKDLGDFNWSALVPDHFRSSLRLEAGLALWDRLVESGPARCDILPPPP